MDHSSTTARYCVGKFHFEIVRSESDRERGRRDDELEHVLERACACVVSPLSRNRHLTVPTSPYSISPPCPPSLSAHILFYPPTLFPSSLTFHPEDHFFSCPFHGATIFVVVFLISNYPIAVLSFN